MSAHSWAVNLVGSLLLALFRNARASASFFSSVPTGLSVPASSHFTPLLRIRPPFRVVHGVNPLLFCRGFVRGEESVVK